MDLTDEKDIFQQASDYDKMFLIMLQDGEFFDRVVDDEKTLSKLKDLGITFKLEQKHDVKECPIIIIRHGLSYFNFQNQLIPQADRTDFQHLSIHNQKYTIDCALHRAGEMQATTKGEWLKEVEIELVLVSPLRRAIQTAYHLLKNHPQKSHIEIVVCPHIIEVLYNISDMITDYQVKKDYFIKLFDEGGMKINFDWVDKYAEKAAVKDHFQMELTTNEDLKKSYTDEFLNKDLKTLTEDDYQDIYRRLFHKNHKTYQAGILEDGPSLHKRFQTTKNELKKYFEEKGLYGKKSHKKILLISHYFATVCLTGKRYLGDWKIEDSIKPSNCEAIPLQWEQLDALFD